MRRPNYGAVTGVVTALSFAGLVRFALLGAIPPPNPRIATWGTGEFVTRAQNQDVQWRPLGAAAFAEARRLARPVFLVIGVPWSAAGRRADDTFASPEIARALNRGFVPIRVDAAQDPRWTSEFLPLRRAGANFSVGFQGWVFDLNGNLIDYVGRMDANDAPDREEVVDALLRAQRRFTEATRTDDLPEMEAAQRADERLIIDPTVSNLSVNDAVDSIAASLDPQWGGWESGGLFAARPLGVRLLQLAGRSDVASRSLRAALLSPRVDWLDGGLFRMVRKDVRTPEYDKVAVVNAQFAEALSAQDATRSDPTLRDFAHRTAAWVLGLSDDGLVAAAEAGDESEQGRSARSSLSPRRLRSGMFEGRLTSESRAWAERYLGLDGTDDPARIVFPRRMETIEASSVAFEKALRELRASAGPPRVRVGAGLADVNGTVAACLLRCARFLDDPRMAEKAGRIVDRLEAFRNDENDVRHSFSADAAGVPYLGDALAYADAGMEDFLTNGRVPSLENGAAVLRRALKRFQGNTPGVLQVSTARIASFRHSPSLPQVTDDEHEATSATALRLLVAYSEVLGPAGADLAEAARRLAANLGSVASDTPDMAGSLAALARFTDPRAAFVVGPNALGVASRLSRRFPSRLVVPVLGPVRPDLRGRPPGVYLGTAAAPSGPWSDDEAATRLPKDLEIGA